MGYSALFLLFYGFLFLFVTCLAILFFSFALLCAAAGALSLSLSMNLKVIPSRRISVLSICQPLVAKLAFNLVIGRSSKVGGLP